LPALNRLLTRGTPRGAGIAANLLPEKCNYALIINFKCRLYRKILSIFKFQHRTFISLANL